MKKYLQAALVSDALALGPHWVYDQEKLARLYPKGLHQFTDPVSSYHPNRKAGQHTHYGDQTRWLASSIEKNGSYQFEKWQQDWLSAIQQYDGFLDGASKATLAHKAQSPSESNDLGGASRIAPILDTELPLDHLITAVRSQTKLTHGDPSVSDCAEFFARAVRALEDGASILEAFEIASETSHSEKLNPAASLQKITSLEGDHLNISSTLGLGCHLPDAFDLTLYLALRPDASFGSTLSENALCGGDSAARAMVLAVLFAARDGEVGAALADGLANSPQS